MRVVVKRTRMGKEGRIYYGLMGLRGGESRVRGWMLVVRLL